MATTRERLQQIMEEENLRQTDIIERAKPLSKQYGSKLTRQDLSQYCHGKVTPSQQKLFLLAAALNVNEAWLMGYDVPRQRTTELQSLTDIRKHPALARLIQSGKQSPIADDMIHEIGIDADYITQDERILIEAYRKADDHTRHLIQYALKIGDLTDADRS